MANSHSRFGKHFLIGLRPTPDLHPADRVLLQTLRPAGIIVFRGNFDHDAPYEAWHERFTRLIASVKEAVARENILICIDHEGGTVLRAPSPITPFSFARQWADRAGLVGAAMAIELASLGVNVNFAPVIDVDSNPDNPVIGPRSFAQDPDSVIACAKAFIAATEEHGVLACPKHFPGHGDTTIDSHYDLPVLELDLSELICRELKPFAAVIQNNISMIMTAHIRFPLIDTIHPATMSKRIINDILREHLGFQGVVISDDIGMNAVSKLFDDPNACTQTLLAGTDLITICSHWTDTDRLYGMISDLERSSNNGQLPDALVEASDRRISALLATAPNNKPYLLETALLKSHSSLAPLRTRQGTAGQHVSLV